MTLDPTDSPTTPPENPAKSKREWESFFARWPSARQEEEKGDVVLTAGEQKLTMEDF